MDESTGPAQCAAIAQLQVSIKRVISPSDVRASQKVGCYVRRDACGCIGCQCQNENPVTLDLTMLADVLHVLMLTRTK